VLSVPLSDNEQQILRQIEAQLESDERFAQAVSPSGLYRPAVKKVRWAALGAVASLALVFVGLQFHFAAGFAGFALMLLCVLVIENHGAHHSRKCQAVARQDGSRAVTVASCGGEGTGVPRR
jgi:hypothetical protein